MYLEDVRQRLLNEAKSSPNLISDLAGLESYIAESYHKRSFVELLQNADDAKATKFKILKSDDFLFVANDGRTFNENDLESLCRSASSNKVRGESIGYRGIGFKSVVAYAKNIHILSGDLELTFSKDRTQSAIPEASRVPLIRIPLEFKNIDKEVINPVYSALKSEGYTTVFIFTGVITHEIISEFDSFEYNSLIFLKNIITTEISLKETVSTNIQKIKLSNTEFKVTLATNEIITSWLISYLGMSSLAFSTVDEKVVKLSQDASLVHAFLPTEDCNGIGILINGDFSTDPSRRHIIFDDETHNSLRICSEHISSLLKTQLNVNNKGNVHIVNALIPYIDPRMLQFKKNSFPKYLLEGIRQSGFSYFKNLKLCPNWLNLKDFQVLVNSTVGYKVDNSFYELEGFTSFAKYLGASEITFEDFKNVINTTDVSFLGCVQLTQYAFKSLLSHNGIKESEIIDLRILHSQGERKSLYDIIINSLILDETFISMLLENGLSEFDIKQVLKKITPNSQIEQHYITPNKEVEIRLEKHNVDLLTKSNLIIDWLDKSREPTKEPVKASIKRWRNAEEQTLEILNLNGFNLEDVSKQNIGYDLSGKDPKGNDFQIEVKSITLPGQKFRLTNNEVAVAQEKQKSFYIAVVRQTESSFEIALISDPVRTLTLNRQCVQWIWECEKYNYNPMKFKLH